MNDPLSDQKQFYATLATLLLGAAIGAGAAYYWLAMGGGLR